MLPQTKMPTYNSEHSCEEQFWCCCLQWAKKEISPKSAKEKKKTRTSENCLSVLASLSTRAHF